MSSSHPEPNMQSLAASSSTAAAAAAPPQPQQQNVAKQRARNPRRMWTAAEDDKLRALVQRYGDARGSQSRWKEVSIGCPGRTPKDCRKRWFHSLDPSLRKGRWTEHEDRVLLSAYATLGPAWHDIALMIPGRKDDQCSKRYNEILDPAAKTRLRHWTPEEDRILTQSVICLGHRWSTISARLNNRPPLTCRNRWRHLSDRGRSPRSGDNSNHASDTSPPAATPRETSGMDLQYDISATPTTGSSDGDQDHGSSLGTAPRSDAFFYPEPPSRNTFVDFIPMSPETESMFSGDLQNLDMMGFAGIDFQQLPLTETSTTDYESTADTHSLRRAPEAALSTIVEPAESVTEVQWDQSSPQDARRPSNTGALTTLNYTAAAALPSPTNLIAGSVNLAAPPAPQPTASTQDPAAQQQQQQQQQQADKNIDFSAIEYNTEQRIEHSSANGPLMHHHYLHHHHHHHHYHHHYHHHNYESPTSTAPPSGNQSAT